MMSRACAIEDFVWLFINHTAVICVFGMKWSNSFQMMKVFTLAYWYIYEVPATASQVKKNGLIPRIKKNEDVNLNLWD